MTESLSITELRRHLAEKFPAAHRSAATLATATAPAPDETRQPKLSQLQAGVISEITIPPTTAGCPALIAALMDSPATDDSEDTTSPVVLIDGTDAFDPTAHSPGQLSRMLWLRCQSAEESIKCADILLRDGSLPHVLLDVTHTPLPELRRIASSSWYRLRHLVEESGVAFIALTAQPLIPCAATRYRLSRSLTLDDLDRLTPPDLQLTQTRAKSTQMA